MAWFFSSKDKSIDEKIKQSNKSGLPSNQDVGDDLMQLTDYSVWKMIDSIRTMTDSRLTQYQEYDDMEKDILISSALELYADDSTQPDTRTGKNVWIHSDDAQLKADLERVLDQFDIPSRLWGWAYSLAQNGDVYLKRFKKDSNPNDHKYSKTEQIISDESDVGIDESTKFESYIEEVDNPANIYDIVDKGVTVNFAELLDDKDVQGRALKDHLRMYAPDEFIHIYVRKCDKLETLEVIIKDENNPTSDAKKKYKVLRGSSMLENIRVNHKILELLEDCMVAAKITKSQTTRLYNVEVGDAAPKKVKEIIARVKHMFDSKSKINTRDGSYRATKSMRPMDDPVIIPTRQGKGTVSTQLIGGDVDVNSIVDVEYFRNKEFAGLKIPKAFLGFEEELPGGNGNSTLTKLDIRYARTIKRIQFALTSGIKRLLEFYLIETDRTGEVGKFEVHLTNPSSAEETDRMQDFQSRIEVGNSIANMIQSLANSSGTTTDQEGNPVDDPDALKVDPKTLVDMILRKIMNLPELADAIFNKKDESTNIRAGGSSNE